MTETRKRATRWLVALGTHTLFSQNQLSAVHCRKPPKSAAQLPPTLTNPAPDKSSPCVLVKKREREREMPRVSRSADVAMAVDVEENEENIPPHNNRRSERVKGRKSASTAELSIYSMCT